MERKCVLGALVAVVLGCDPGVDSPTLEERLLDVAELNGFEVTDATFDDGVLVIDDVVFTAEHLEEYELTTDDSYRAWLKNEDNKVVSPGFRDICFEIDNDGANSAELWVATFNAVTKRMNELNTTLSFVNRRKSVGCPSSRERIQVVTKNFWSDTKAGEADWPTKNLAGNTKPGKKIKLKRDFDPTRWWNDDTAQVVASHELMHTLGFVHIDSGHNNHDHVSGTCESASGCETIMFADGDDIPSTPADGLLEDDELALETVY